MEFTNGSRLHVGVTVGPYQRHVLLHYQSHNCCSACLADTAKKPFHRELALQERLFHKARKGSAQNSWWIGKKCVPEWQSAFCTIISHMHKQDIKCCKWLIPSLGALKDFLQYESGWITYFKKVSQTDKYCFTVTFCPSCCFFKWQLISANLDLMVSQICCKSSLVSNTEIVGLRSWFRVQRGYDWMWDAFLSLKFILFIRLLYFLMRILSKINPRMPEA